MNRTWKTAVLLAACATAATFTAADESNAAGSVTTTKDDCIIAWAILHNGSAEGREGVLNVVKWHPHWKGGAYEPGISQSFQLHTFDRAFQGGSVTVAHCGHGATCNALAHAVLKAWPNAASPVVYCTLEPPHILNNPQNL